MLAPLEATPTLVNVLFIVPNLYCEWCGLPIYVRVGRHQKYHKNGICDFNGEREKTKNRVYKHRKKYKHCQKESLGSGWITSCHPESTFEKEYQTIKNEFRRLGLR
jgi:hypothetical protein